MFSCIKSTQVRKGIVFTEYFIVMKFKSSKFTGKMYNLAQVILVMQQSGKMTQFETFKIFDRP